MCVYEKMSDFMMNILNICFLKPSKLVHRFSDIRAKSLHPGQCLDAGVASGAVGCTEPWLPGSQERSYRLRSRGSLPSCGSAAD